MSPIRSTRRLTTACALTCALLASVTSGQAAAQSAHQPPASPDVQSVAGVQDLRSVDTRDAAQRPRRAQRPVNAPGATAVDSATRPALPGPPTWPVNPQPIKPAPVVHASDGGNGLDWTTIGLGLAGALLAVGSVVVIARHSRRIGRARVAA